LLTLTVVGAGFAPPRLALNETELEESCKAGPLVGNEKAPMIPPPVLWLTQDPAKTLPAATLGAANVAAAV
jgi:hypothetical protein